MASPLHVSFDSLRTDVVEYGVFLRSYARERVGKSFKNFEFAKDVLVDLLYKQRGRYARPFLHVGVVILGFSLVTLGPWILTRAQSVTEPQPEVVGGVLPDLSSNTTSFYTQQADAVRQYRGGEVITHSVAEGETLSTIADRYGLQVSTILWKNNLTEKATLKPGQELAILPVDGVEHKVARGETIYSIGKKYGLDESQVQAIIDYPFNVFSNDETFELATGQTLIVPGGVRQDSSARPSAVARILTPDAGTVSATGSFIWPASGRITQGYSFYHKAIDVAQKSGGNILAADSGTVLVAGWIDNSGYGNRILIDHGNGYATLYAHLSLIQVRVGQRVNRGDVIGQMGSTGRSTGVHLHFEIRQGGTLLNPLSLL